jgi:hypothetical protein
MNKLYRSIEAVATYQSLITTTYAWGCKEKHGIQNHKLYNVMNVSK